MPPPCPSWRQENPRIAAAIRGAPPPAPATSSVVRPPRSVRRVSGSDGRECRCRPPPRVRPALRWRLRPEIAARSIRQDRTRDNTEEMLSSWRGRGLIAEPRKRSS